MKIKILSFSIVFLFISTLSISQSAKDKYEFNKEFIVGSSKFTILNNGGIQEDYISNITIDNNQKINLTTIKGFSKESEFYIQINDKISRKYENIKVLSNVKGKNNCFYYKIIVPSNNCRQQRIRKEDINKSLLYNKSLKKYNYIKINNLNIQFH